MSLNIANLNNGYNFNAQAIDVKAVKDITSQILDTKNTAPSVDLDKLNLSKFRRAELGVDLYSSRTNVEQASQIAIRNSGIDVNLNQSFIANVQYLNSQAAQTQNVNKITKQVEGKIVVPVAEDSQVNLREVFALPKAAQLFEAQNLDKDKRGSNPFSYHKPAAKKEAEKTEGLNIFA